MSVPISARAGSSPEQSSECRACASAICASTPGRTITNREQQGRSSKRPGTPLTGGNCMAKYLKSGGGRHRPTEPTGGLQAGFAVRDAIEKVFRERAQAARAQRALDSAGSGAEVTAEGRQPVQSEP
jgi:hypothetical protein